MKKLFFAAVIAVFSMTSMNAQTFGVTAGYDATSFGGDGNGSESGFYAGAFAEFELSDTFNFRPEVLYSAVKDFSSVKIPLLVGYEFTEGFSAVFGPSINLILEDDPNDALKSLDFGITAGLSYDFTDQLFAEARYSAGLSNISEFNGVDVTVNSFLVGIGYRFN